MSARGEMALLPWLVLRHLRRSAPSRAGPSVGASRPGLSVVMAAHNEADVIIGCIESVREIATEVIVLDAESSDATARVAAEHGARVVAAVNHPMLEINKNLALADATFEWVLVLDPDERVSPRLAAQIRRVTDERPSVDGYWMPRRNYILGRWFRAMGMYPGSQLRLVRRGRGRFSEEDHHRPMHVDGAVDCLTGDLIHLSDATVVEILRKRIAYADYAAGQMHAHGTSFSVLAMAMSPVRSFSVQFLLLGGWLEGARGLIYAGLSAYGALMRHARLWELERDEVSRGR